MLTIRRRLKDWGAASVTKEKLNSAVEAAKTETRDALQTMFDAMNNGQQKQIVKVEAVKKLFDRYGVSYEEEK